MRPDGLLELVLVLSYICVIPSEAEGPRIFLDARHFDSAEGPRSRAAPVL